MTRISEELRRLLADPEIAAGLSEYLARDRAARLLSTCGFCDLPVEPGAWVEVRLYNGPGDKIGALQVDVCRRHLDAMRPAFERELVECRVTRWERGRARTGRSQA